MEKVDRKMLRLGVLLLIVVLMDIWIVWRAA